MNAALYSNTRPTRRQGIAFALIFSVFALLPFALLAMAGLSGCSESAPPATVSSAATAPARIGKLVMAIETPAVVQGEVQFGVAQILQRAVSPEKRADVAAWVSNADKALRSFEGGALPSGAELTATIDKYAGPQKDPLFPLVVATIVDGVELAAPIVEAKLAADPRAGVAREYLDAAATGASNAASGYLPSTGEAP